MTDLDSWLEDYRPYTTSVSVCGRADLVATRGRLEANLAAALAASKRDDLLNSPDLAAAKRASEDNDAAIEAAQRTFTFVGVGHREWQDLKRKYPPSDEERRAGLDTAMERFAPAMIAASSADDVPVTVEQATKLMDKLPAGEFDKLFEAALQANGQVVAGPKSVLAALIERSLQNGDSSTTSLPEGSPDLSLLDDDDALSPESSEGTTDG